MLPISSLFRALSSVVVVNGERDYGDVLAELRTMLAQTFHIDHVTIQVEPAGFHEQRPHV